MNPFLTNIRGFDGKRMGASAVDERLNLARDFSAAQCRAALKLPYVQKTVRLAIERRLRKLERAS